MDDLQRAALAKELLESLMFKEAHQAIRNELIVALETVEFDNIERQHELVVALQLHNRTKKKLERWVDEGKLEQKKLDQENWRDKLRQRWVG